MKSRNLLSILGAALLALTLTGCCCWGGHGRWGGHGHGGHGGHHGGR